MEAMIFDLDGVIVDTAKYHYLAWKRLSNEFGFDFSEKDNERLKGVSRMQSLEILLEIGNVCLDEKMKLLMAEKKNKWYVEYISRVDESELLPGAKECILMLKKQGVKTAIGSASKNAAMILNKLGIYGLFDVIVDGNAVTKAKPDPEVFLECSRQLGVSPDNCTVFEDSVAGLDAAKACGMKCVGVGRKEDLYMADYVVDSLIEQLDKWQ